MKRHKALQGALAVVGTGAALYASYQILKKLFYVHDVPAGKYEQCLPEHESITVVETLRAVPSDDGNGLHFINKQDARNPDGRAASDWQSNVDWQEDGDQQDEEDEAGITFTPRLYIQRYMGVADILSDNKAIIKSVVDFGCAECKFLAYISKMRSLENLVGVDIDKFLLETNSFRLTPEPAPLVFARDTPLAVSLFHGSIAEEDSRLRNFDAVTAIEIIEHLEDDVLSQVPKTIFGFIRPKIAIFTTPNSDFNVIFPNFTGFRHSDHKFEWSREEFRKWCEHVTATYPDYTVELGGMGDPPVDMEHVGYCSQMAVFHKTNEQSSPDNSEAVSPYEEVIRYDHPFTSMAERLFNAAVHTSYKQASDELELAMDSGGADPSEPHMMCVPLEFVLAQCEVSALCADLTVDELQKIIAEHNQLMDTSTSSMKLSADGKDIVWTFKGEDTSDESFVDEGVCDQYLTVLPENEESWDMDDGDRVNVTTTPDKTALSDSHSQSVINNKSGNKNTHDFYIEDSYLAHARIKECADD